MLLLLLLCPSHDISFSAMIMSTLRQFLPYPTSNAEKFFGFPFDCSQVARAIDQLCSVCLSRKRPSPHDPAVAFSLKLHQIEDVPPRRPHDLDNDKNPSMRPASVAEV